MSKEPVKGAFYLASSKIYFVITSYALYFALSRILSPEDFGDYGVIIGLVSVVNMMFISGGLQAVSKLVSERGAARGVLGPARFLQLFIGGGAFLIFFAFAGRIAGFFNDPGLTPSLRAASFIILFYSFYAAHIGALNGLKLFRSQAIFDASFSTIKLILMLSLAVGGFLLPGAISGFSLAALMIMTASFFYVQRKTASEDTASSVPLKKLLIFQTTLMLSGLLVNLIMNTDLFFIKKMSPGGPTGLDTAYYTACLTLSRIPSMVLTSLNFVLFPMISQATRATEDPKTAARYIQNGLRVCLMVSLGLAVLLSASSLETILFVYPERFAPAAEPLGVISFGYALFAVFLTATTVLAGGGKPALSVMITAAALILQVVLCFLWVPRHGILGAAFSTTLAMAAGLVAAGFALWSKFRAAINLLSFVRILGTAGSVYILGAQIPASGVFLLAKDLILLAGYVLFLRLTGEIGPEDLRSLRASWSAKK